VRKNTVITFFIVFFVIGCGLGFGLGYIFFGRHQDSGAGVAEYSSRKGEYNRAITDSQRRTEAGITTERGFIESARARIERTDRSLAELGELDRRSDRLLEQIIERTYILEDFYIGVSGDIGNYDSNFDSEVNK
jgi:hypothetical protein